MLYNNLRRISLRYLSNKALPVVTLYSKAEGCSLCEDAKDVLMKFNDKFVYEEVDITAAGNNEWNEMYKYDIPVIHINGVEVMRHKVFDKALLEALNNAQK